jgi:hypothetical protein
MEQPTIKTLINLIFKTGLRFQTGTLITDIDHLSETPVNDIAPPAKQCT